MTTPTLAITGSTGAVGGAVARLISEAELPQLLLARTIAKAPSLPRSTVAPFSYADREASVAALTGSTVLFMVSASESAERVEHHKTFIDAARDAGVEHIVYTSFHAAAPDAVFTLARDHWETEEHIKNSGMSWTFLRDGFYIDLMPYLVGDDGVIRGPAGTGRAAFVAQADVARSAVAVLLDPRAHENVTYNITGREALTLAEVAAAISAARGTEVTFYDETLEEAYASRRVYDAPEWEVDAWVSTYTSIAQGEQAEISHDVERLTGRPASTLAEFLESTR